MLRVALAALVLALSSQLVHGTEEACRVYRVGEGHVEWIEDGEQRGGRFVSRTAEWESAKSAGMLPLWRAANRVLPD